MSSLAPDTDFLSMLDAVVERELGPEVHGVLTHHVPARIISGGQTGVDRAGLDAGLALGIDIGGTCPARRRADGEPIPDRYPLTEHPSPKYPPRTRCNVEDADATVILVYPGGETSPGSKLTAHLADEAFKPHIMLDVTDWHSPRALWEWLATYRPQTLNVAGNREASYPGIHDRAQALLTAALRPTRVVNLRKEPYDVYVGRAGHGEEGYFGKPRGLPSNGSGGWITYYRSYLEGRTSADPEFHRRLEGLRSHTLGCFCLPRPCHGTIIKEWLESPLPPASHSTLYHVTAPRYTAGLVAANHLVVHAAPILEWSVGRELEDVLGRLERQGAHAQSYQGTCISAGSIADSLE